MTTLAVPNLKRAIERLLARRAERLVRAEHAWARMTNDPEGGVTNR